MRMPRVVALLLGWMIVPFVALSAEDVPEAAAVPWAELALPRTEYPAEFNALVRWRPLYDQLFPKNPELREQVQTLSSPLADFPSGNTDSIKGFTTWLAELAPVFVSFEFRADEALQFPPLLGPETPFPDHQPLRQLVLVRVAALKAAWAGGARDEALALALENLALSRAFMRAQEGLIPVLTASDIWQRSLDAVYWLARQPALTPADAARLQDALMADDRLAANALIRAFRGEFTFFTLTTLNRLPRTNDVEVFLSSIGSLGLAPPSSPAEGTPRLAIPERSPFDREATRQAAADDVQGWVKAFTDASRHPRGLMATHTRQRLQAYAREIPLLLRYAVQDTPPTVEQAHAVDAEIAAAENSVGKVFMIITTSQWESISASVFRREAQRSALTGLLAWRRFGKTASWPDLVMAGLLPSAPADPFSDAHLYLGLNPPRVWSVAENGVDDGGAGDGQNLGRPPDLAWPLPGLDTLGSP